MTAKNEDLHEKGILKQAVCYILSRITQKVKQKKQKAGLNRCKNQKISIKSMIK
jgi:hypothetical protein